MYPVLLAGVFYNIVPDCGLGAEIWDLKGSFICKRKQLNLGLNIHNNVNEIYSVLSC